MRKYVLLLTCLLSTGLSLAGYAAQRSKPVNKSFNRGMQAITRQHTEASLYFLASDAMRGRLAGSIEGKIAAEYLVSELRQLGYEPEVQPFLGRRGENLQNILVTVPGTDPTERIIVGAHYDHEGVKRGEIYNGADDNASGAVAILELARAVQAAGVQPRRTVVLALWDGEERGLQGSRHYAAQIQDTAAVKYYINFDMIGRNTDEQRPGIFRYFYTEANPEARQWLSEVVVKYKLDQLEPDYRPWDKPVGGSDNASFARRGIPIVWYHTDGHPDFHKPGDTPDKINYPKMVDIIRSAWYLIWQMAY